MTNPADMIVNGKALADYSHDELIKLYEDGEAMGLRSWDDGVAHLDALAAELDVREAAHAAKIRKARAARYAKIVAAMPVELVERVERMVRDGYGARGIVLESPATLQQVNAVFEKVQSTKA